MDFQNIWHNVSHGQHVSEQELSAAESALRSADRGDRHLPILIVGVARKPEPSLIALMEGFLGPGHVDAERYCALRVLCRYWGLWDRYLPNLLSKTSPEEFEKDPAISDEAFTLMGEYLSSHADRTAWRHLVAVYDSAVKSHNDDLAADAYSSIYRAVLGGKAMLRREASEDRKHDPQVLAAARSNAGLTQAT